MSLVRSRGRWSGHEVAGRVKRSLVRSRGRWSGSEEEEVQRRTTRYRHKNSHQITQTCVALNQSTIDYHRSLPFNASESLYNSNQYVNAKFKRIFVSKNLQRFVNSADDSSASSCEHKTLGYDAAWLLRVSDTSLLYPVRSSSHIGSQFRLTMAAPSRLSRSWLTRRSCIRRRSLPSAQCIASQ